MDYITQNAVANDNPAPWSRRGKVAVFTLIGGYLTTLTLGFGLMFKARHLAAAAYPAISDAATLAMGASIISTGVGICLTLYGALALYASDGPVVRWIMNERD